MAALAASVTPASVVQEGYVWRGSDVFCDIVNLRYAKLYPDVLVTYRKETHSSPSKAWPLYAGCMLTDVEGRELMFCHRGYNNVFARLSGRFERVEAFMFTVSWLQERLPMVTRDTSLTLAFDNPHEAHEWHRALRLVFNKMAPDATSPSCSVRIPLASDRKLLERSDASESSEDMQGASDQSQGRQSPQDNSSSLTSSSSSIPERVMRHRTRPTHQLELLDIGNCCPLIFIREQLKT